MKEDKKPDEESVKKEREARVEAAVDFVVALNLMQGRKISQRERDDLKREALELAEGVSEDGEV